MFAGAGQFSKRVIPKAGEELAEAVLKKPIAGVSQDVAGALASRSRSAMPSLNNLPNANTAQCPKCGNLVDLSQRDFFNQKWHVTIYEPDVIEKAPKTVNIPDAIDVPAKPVDAPNPWHSNNNHPAMNWAAPAAWIPSAADNLGDWSNAINDWVSDANNPRNFVESFAKSQVENFDLFAPDMDLGNDMGAKVGRWAAAKIFEYLLDKTKPTPPPKPEIKIETPVIPAPTDPFVEPILGNPGETFYPINGFPQNVSMPVIVTVKTTTRDVGRYEWSNSYWAVGSNGLPVNPENPETWDTTNNWVYNFNLNITNLKGVVEKKFPTSVNGSVSAEDGQYKTQYRSYGIVADNISGVNLPFEAYQNSRIYWLNSKVFPGAAGQVIYHEYHEIPWNSATGFHYDFATRWRVTQGVITDINFDYQTQTQTPELPLIQTFDPDGDDNMRCGKCEAREALRELRQTITVNSTPITNLPTGNTLVGQTMQQNIQVMALPGTAESIRQQYNLLDEMKKRLAKTFNQARMTKVMSKITQLMNITQFVLDLHTAMMMSSDIVESFWSPFTSLLDTMAKVVDETPFIGDFFDLDEKPLNSGEILGKTFEDAMKKVFGVNNWEEIKAKWASFNNIIRGAATQIQTMRDFNDSQKELAEMTASKLGKLHNKLAKSGAIFDDDMWNENVTARSAWLNKFMKLEEFADDNPLTNTAQWLNSWGSQVLDIREQKKELAESKAKYQKDLADDMKVLTEGKKASQDASLGANFSRSDANKPEADTTQAD